MAVNWYGHVIKMDPKNARVRTNLGFVNLRLHLFSEAKGC